MGKFAKKGNKYVITLDVYVYFKMLICFYYSLKKMKNGLNVG